MSSNPWLKKNPFLSMWLSGANKVAGQARAQASAEVRRAADRGAKDAMTVWTDLWFPKPPSAVAPKRKRRR